MKRAVVIEPDGSVRPLIIPDPPPTELSVLQATIGGYLEPIRHSLPNLTAFCDEDGGTKNLPVNFLATAVFRHRRVPHPIVGTVVVMGATTTDGEIVSLTPEQADIFLSPASEHILNALAER